MSTNINLNQRRAARFVSKYFRHQRSVSDMLRDWNTPEDRGTISRLALLYKTVHNVVTINVDEYYTNYAKENITTRKTSAISFIHPTAGKNCHRHSFMP